MVGRFGYIVRAHTHTHTHNKACISVALERCRYGLVGYSSRAPPVSALGCRVGVRVGVEPVGSRLELGV